MESDDLSDDLSSDLSADLSIAMVGSMCRARRALCVCFSSVHHSVGCWDAWGWETLKRYNASSTEPKNGQWHHWLRCSCWIFGDFWRPDIPRAAPLFARTCPSLSHPAVLKLWSKFGANQQMVQYTVTSVTGQVRIHTFFQWYASTANVRIPCWLKVRKK
jgi:hypothetical protein